MRPTDFINLRGPRQLQRHQHRRIYPPLLVTGRADHDLRHSCRLGQGHRHDHRGNQRSAPSRHINPHPLERLIDFAHFGTLGVFHRPVLPQPLFCKAAHIFMRQCQRPLHLRRHCHRRFLQFRWGHRQGFHGQLRAIKFLGKTQQGLVAILHDLRNDARDIPRKLRRRHMPPVETAHLSSKRRGGVGEAFHHKSAGKPSAAFQ